MTLWNTPDVFCTKYVHLPSPSLGHAFRIVSACSSENCSSSWPAASTRASSPHAVCALKSLPPRQQCPLAATQERAKLGQNFPKLGRHSGRDKHDQDAAQPHRHHRLRRGVHRETLQQFAPHQESKPSVRPATSRLQRRTLLVPGHPGEVTKREIGAEVPRLRDSQHVHALSLLLRHDGKLS